MKNNIFKFPKPANQDKKYDSPKVVKAVLIIMAMLTIIKVFGLDDFRPEVYRQHEVVILDKPIKLPEGYVVSDLSGKSAQLTDLLGEDITILAFWATWCGYCAKEFPEMDEVVPYLARHGVKILPIARGDDTPQKINQFFAKGNIKNVESVIASTHSLHSQLGVAGYPTFYAVDKNGMAFAKLRPKWTASDIFDLFEKLGKR